MPIVRWLFGLCKHEWVVLQHWPLYAQGAKLSHGDRYVLQCKRCGNLKKKEIL